MRSRKLKKAILIPLIATPILCFSFIGIAQAGWLTTIQDSTWEPGNRTLFNVVFDYQNNDDITFTGLEKSSKLDMPEFVDERYQSVWKIGEHSYSGVVSVNTLFSDSGALTPTVNGKISTYTITLTETIIGLNNGYFEINVVDGINMSNANAHLDLDYSLVTRVIDRFLVFNINPTYTGLNLDHFVYDPGGANEQVYELNDSLFVNTGGADASKLVNKTLTLTAYFKS